MSTRHTRLIQILYCLIPSNSNSRERPFARSSCMLTSLILIFSLVSTTNCASQTPTRPVQTGAEQLIQNHLDKLKGKRIGLVMNPTARVNGTHMLDTLLARHVNITALFAPEHGFRGDKGAGETITDGIDQATGLPVFSLYGETKTPTPQMLENVDLLLFDMQDVGARFYTYNVTLGRVIEAASASDVPVWVLDRPNPAGGDYVSGWILEEEAKSFVGAWPIPIAHGMTLGELGAMIIGEGWIEAKPEHYRVIEMQGWNRSMRWPETELPWIAPSPNLPTFEHALVYLGTCLVEGTEFSEGRGTPDPFLTIGAPKMKVSKQALHGLEQQYGVQISDTTFTPKDIPGKAWNPKFEGQECQGIAISLPKNQVPTYQPVEFGGALVSELLKQNPEYEMIPFLEKLTGRQDIEVLFKNNPATIIDSWSAGISDFQRKRASYLLYN
ncbi:MAG: exo-beta-N-acetylmuramidase NamZ family protein [Bacteroidota bacterium]